MNVRILSNAELDAQEARALVDDEEMESPVMDDLAQHIHHCRHRHQDGIDSTHVRSGITQCEDFHDAIVKHDR